MQVNKHVKHPYFMVKACKLATLLVPYRLHWFFDKECCTFQSAYGKSNINLIKGTSQEFKVKIVYFTSNTIVATDGSS